MTLITLTVVVIALLTTTLAIYLFTIGVLLNRTADNLDDSLRSLRTIANQANVIGPAVERINLTGTELVGALPQLHELAQRIDAKPSIDAKPAPTAATPLGLGYLDT